MINSTHNRTAAHVDLKTLLCVIPQFLRFFVDGDPILKASIEVLINELNNAAMTNADPTFLISRNVMLLIEIMEVLRGLDSSRDDYNVQQSVEDFEWRALAIMNAVEVKIESSEGE